MICPHLNSAFMGGTKDAIRFLMGGIELVKRSDAIYMLKNWESSAGARQEYETASLMGKQIIFEDLEAMNAKEATKANY